MMETMESRSFYHDTKKGVVNSLKSNMTLDFSSKNKRKLMADILNSPDINMLKLASPELERLIIQQGGMATTPTPNTQILFPKSVTEEQEAYARGFVDALAELHTKGETSEEDEDDSDSTMDDGMSTGNGPTYTTLTTVSGGKVRSTAQAPFSLQAGPTPATSTNNGVYTYTTVAQLPNSALPQNVMTSMPSSTVNMQGILSTSSTSSPAMHPYAGASQHMQVMQVKQEEPQRVPSMSPSMSPQLLQLSPINMVHQEGVKLERKRARNRVAARKCRTRKLERISRLEDRVDDLKGLNGNLVQTASELREQVFALKQQIMEHVNSGCKVMLSANML